MTTTETAQWSTTPLSHIKLLDVDPVAAEPRAGGGVDVDAIIVPAARTTRSLETAIKLAHELGADCLALCSRNANAADAAGLGKQVDSQVTAIQTETTDVLPAFWSGKVLRAAEFDNDNADDIAHKRNLALLVARLSGWKRVFLLDDDVVDVRASDVRGAAALLHDYDAVGLKNVGYPDNSVVYHAKREVLGEQGQFISTMALALSVGTQSFFPAIYNEDWLFFLGDLPDDQWKPRLAATGRVKQRTFDPFADPERARREEFGDVIAEGLFRLLDKKRPMKEADIEHWSGFLADRRDLIDRLIRSIDSTWSRSRSARASRIAALEAASEQHEKIAPSLCADYIDAWRTDLTTWRDLIASLDVPSEPTVAGALEQLGLTAYAHTSW